MQGGQHEHEEQEHAPSMNPSGMPMLHAHVSSSSRHDFKRARSCRRAGRITYASPAPPPSSSPSPRSPHAGQPQSAPPHRSSSFAPQPTAVRNACTPCDQTRLGESTRAAVVALGRPAVSVERQAYLLLLRCFLLRHLLSILAPLLLALPPLGLNLLAVGINLDLLLHLAHHLYRSVHTSRTEKRPHTRCGK